MYFILVLARANVAILVDSGSLVDFGYVRHCVYNIIRMFALSGSYFSVISYSSSIYRVCNFVQFKKPDDIKAMAEKIPKSASGQVTNMK